MLLLWGSTCYCYWEKHAVAMEKHVVAMEKNAVAMENMMLLWKIMLLPLKNNNTYFKS